MQATLIPIPDNVTDVVKIAFVGSSEKWWMPYQRQEAIEFILKVLRSYPKVEIVSGGCPYGGVDIWTESIGYALGIPVTIFNPKMRNWDGYKNRNIKIAEYCDILYCIEPEWESDMGASKAFIWRGMKARRSGGIWTMNYARDVCDRQVHVEVIPA